MEEDVRAATPSERFLLMLNERMGAVEDRISSEVDIFFPDVGRVSSGQEETIRAEIRRVFSRVRGLRDAHAFRYCIDRFHYTVHVTLDEGSTPDKITNLLNAEMMRASSKLNISRCHRSNDHLLSIYLSSLWTDYMRFDGAGDLLDFQRVDRQRLPPHPSQ